MARKSRSAGRPKSKRTATPPYSPAAVRASRLKVLLTLSGLLVGVSVAAVFTSPALAIHTIALKGAEGLPADEIALLQRTADLPPGTNLFRVPTANLKSRLAAIPCVEKVTLLRHFPNRLEIQVTRREPVAAVQTEAGTFEVDAAGVPIRPLRPEQQDTLPPVALARARPMPCGVPQNDPALSAALEALHTGSEKPGVPIAKIEVDRNDNLCLNMRDGMRIRLGLPDELPVKLAQVHLLYAREPDIARRLVAINLSSSDWPVCIRRDQVPAVPERETASPERRLPARRASSG